MEDRMILDMKRYNFNSQITWLFLLAILFSSLCGLGSKAYGEDSYCVYVVSDTRDNSINSVADTTRDIVKAIRGANNPIVTVKNLPLRFVDLADPKCLPLFKDVLKLEKGDLPFIGIAKIDSGLNFISFVDGGSFRKFSNPRSAAEAIMNRVKETLPADKKANFRPFLFTGFKTIKTTPPGADISVGGVKAGKSPLADVVVPSLKLTVTASLQNYKDTSRDFSFDYGDVKEIELDLVQQKGSLTIISNPAGADVYIDNANSGKTPLSIGNIMTGSHEILLKKSSFKDLKASVSIIESQANTQSFNLTKSKFNYSLTINSNMVEINVMNPLTHKFETKEFEMDVKSLNRKLEDALNGTDQLEPCAPVESPDLQITVEATPTEQTTLDISIKEVKSGRIIFKDQVTTSRPLMADPKNLSDAAGKVFADKAIPKIVNALGVLQ